jgi:FtsP/CotA-like multicopper oxidase with cupredoxin domain
VPPPDDGPRCRPRSGAGTYRATVDVPARFRKSKAVGAVVGLTLPDALAPGFKYASNTSVGIHPLMQDVGSLYGYGAAGNPNDATYPGKTFEVFNGGAHTVTWSNELPPNTPHFLPVDNTIHTAWTEAGSRFVFPQSGSGRNSPARRAHQWEFRWQSRTRSEEGTRWQRRGRFGITSSIAPGERIDTLVDFSGEQQDFHSRQ